MAPPKARIVLAAANELERQEIGYNSNAEVDKNVWLRARREASQQARILKEISSI